MLVFITSAFAGGLWFIDMGVGELRMLDTRTMVDSFGRSGADVPTGSVGMSYWPASRTYSFLSDQIVTFGWDFTYEWMGQWDAVSLVGGVSDQYPPRDRCSTALSYDDAHQTLVIFEHICGGQLYYGAMWDMWTGQVIQYTGIPNMEAADWYPPGGYHLVLAEDGFYAVDWDQPPVFLAPHPVEITPLLVQWRVRELAYDEDTRLVWVTQRDGFWLVDPLSWSVVGWLPSQRTNVDGGAAIPDPVPDQQPELLVTGTCPGTVYITAVDATPNGDVHVASSTRLGAHRIANGPCAGQDLGLTSPRPRATLQANAHGVASVQIQATSAMCGRWHLQAVDMDTCMVTSARTVPQAVVP